MAVSDELKNYIKAVRVEHDRRIDDIYLRKTDFSQSSGGLSLADLDNYVTKDELAVIPISGVSSIFVDLSNYVTKDELSALIGSGGGSSITYEALDLNYIFADNNLDADYLSSSDALDINYIFGTT